MTAHPSIARVSHPRALGHQVHSIGVHANLLTTTPVHIPGGTMNRLAAMIVAVVPITAHAQVESTSQSMPYEACLQTISSVASQLQTVPINIVETNDLRI